MRRGSLGQFGHVERMEYENCVNESTHMNVDGRIFRDRLKLAWEADLQNNLELRD